MSAIKWQLLTTLSDVPSAQALASRLAAEGISVRVSSDASVLGQAAPCRVLVDSSQQHKIGWLMSDCVFTEQELVFLSTGKSAEGESDLPGT